jgi:hypothetical protein
MIGKIIGSIKKMVMGFIKKAVGFFKGLILPILAFIQGIGNCILKVSLFFSALFRWFGAIFIWVFNFGKNTRFSKIYKDEVPTVGPIAYIIRYIIVIAMKVASIPKCMLWYIFDFIGWVIYLPFRLLFWSLDYMFDLGIVKGEHAIWKFFGELDYFIHGPKDNYFIRQYKDGANIKNPDPNSLNTGVHLFHFPNSTMIKCYSVQAFKLAPFPSFTPVSKAIKEIGGCMKKKKKSSVSTSE